MTDIELVIKIPKYVYNTIVANDGYIADCDNEKVGMAIINGTSLPKEHGRLIDADAINRKDVNCANVPMNFIDTAPTIIKADNVESENKE